MMRNPATKKPRPRWLSDLLILAGGLALLWALLTSIKPILASNQLDNGNYLISGLEISLPLPDPATILNSEPITDDVFYPLLYKTGTPTPMPTPTPAPTPVPSAGPVVRLVIPKIQVNRAVVPLRQYQDSSGNIQYDTNKLFATNNRLDLVGQVITSTNPGDGSNTVLVGHNYNRGWYAWEGVFVNLKKLKPGDKIVLHTKDGSKHTYHVTKIVEVPWYSKNSAEINKHLKYLGPKPQERVTLVTCGGAFGVWSARVYVIAK
jgi:LPXTG-site transpeptidase (sortase) family protein